MVDDPREYEELSSQAKEAVQYWIAKAIRSATTICSNTSYVLKHDYADASVSRPYLTNGQFKGAMRAAGYVPIDEGEQNWRFKIGPTYDKRRIPHDITSQTQVASLPTFRLHHLGEPDQELERLVNLAQQEGTMKQ